MTLIGLREGTHKFGNLGVLPARLPLGRVSAYRRILNPKP